MAFSNDFVEKIVKGDYQHGWQLHSNGVIPAESCRFGKQ